MKKLIFSILFISRLSFGFDVVPTIYSILKVSMGSCEVAEQVPFLDKQNRLLGQVCPDQYSKCAVEGSCRVEVAGKVQILNVVSYQKKTGRTRWAELNPKRCAYGIGANDICLDPFFSVSADSEIYSLGDVIEVPILKGLKLPTGEIHSGYVIVRDRHDLLEGTGAGRIHFFTGFWSDTSKENPFVKLHLDDPETKLQAHRVEGSMAQKIKQIRNFPLLPGVLRQERLLQ